MSFFTTVLETAQQAAALTGVLPSVILAQWADETARGSSPAFVQGHNFAGVTIPGSKLITGVTAYPNYTAGLTSYVQTMNAALYNAVRQAKGWQAQCVALGASPWATAHYDTAWFRSGKPFATCHPGVDLINIIESTNLTQYDSGFTFSGIPTAPAAPSTASTKSPAPKTTTPTVAFHKAYTTVQPPAPGFTSTAGTGQIVINDTPLDLIVSGAIVTVQLDLAITKTSTMTLTIHDPTREIINSPQLNQRSLLSFSGPGVSVPYTYVLVAVEKQGSVLTCTFASYVPTELGQLTGPFTIAPETMTRTDFAALLVSQLAGTNFASASEAFLDSLDDRYTHTNQEALSRGTVDNPLESSWAALQRLASEIQWVCFAGFTGDPNCVYFGPYSYLASQIPVLAPREFQDGITTIDGTWDTGQPIGKLTITCVADSWTPTPGQCIAITDLGPLNGPWIVSEMEREDLQEPDITVTCMLPQPSLPEPSTGGTNPAVGSGAGNVQSTTGQTQAKKALAFEISKVGHPYSETQTAGVGPTYYDCSGLAMMAYESVGIQIPRSTYTQWPSGAGPSVPPGIGYLRPGDLLYFGYGVGQAAQHVAMVDTVTRAKGTVHVVQAADPAQGVCYATMTPTIGASYGTGTLVYLGALRPAP